MEKKTLFYSISIFYFLFFVYISYGSLISFSLSLSLFSLFFYIINILFFIQIAYFIFCKIYTKFKKIIVRESFLWLFFVRGMVIF
jgi:hypothetical protein